ncbi:MAG TPA: ribosome recycling factor [Planctomycetota bacterium]|nr:ribosome recycling factor [Planctomycetota bacterium]
MDYQSVLDDAKGRMEKALGVLRDKFRGMRTGRASPGLVEELRVEYYGSPTPLKQIANITAPEADQIVIKPYDAGSLDGIQKAILKSDLGITPQSDGKIVRLTIPPLSQERRKQLANAAKEASEEARVAIRNIRRDANKSADQLGKDSGLSEDDVNALKEEIQGLVKDFEKRVDDLLKKKTEELTSL